MTKQLRGRINLDLHFAGTCLRLREGEDVHVIEATNLPQGGYFVRPVEPGPEWGFDTFSPRIGPADITL